MAAPEPPGVPLDVIRITAAGRTTDYTMDTDGKLSLPPEYEGVFGTKAETRIHRQIARLDLTLPPE